MGAVNLSVLNKAKWRARTSEAFSSAARMMCETFSIDSLYPTREVERPLNSGQYIEVQQAMQHQAVYHAKLTPSGKEPKFVLLSGGMGSGKSVAACVELLWLLRTYPGIQICADGNSKVGGVPLGDRVAPESVRTVHGFSETSTPYKRGQADLWRVQTQSGRTMSVTEGHRFLTPRGYCRLSDLSVGDYVACDDTPYDSYYSGKSTGYSGSYQKDLRCDDGLLCPEAVSALHVIRQFLLLYIRVGTSDLASSSGCLNPSEQLLLEYDEVLRFGSEQDERPATKFQESPRWLDNSLRSYTAGLSHLQEVLSGLSALPPSLSHTFVAVAETLGLDLSDVISRLHGYSSVACSPDKLDRRHISAVGCFVRDLRKLRTYAELSRWSSDLLRTSQQRGVECLILQTLGRLLGDLSLLFSPHYKYTSKWEEISSICYDKYADFFDLTVYSGANYACEGIFSHNCVVAAFDYYFDEFFLPTWHSIFSEEENPLIKRHNVKSRTTVLTNGSVLRCKAYDDADRIKGWQAHVIFIMEAGLLGDRFPQKARAIFNALTERLRAPGRHFPRRIYLDQNPEGHNWSWELFIKPNPLGDAGKVTYIPADDWYPNGGKYREYEHTTPTGDTYYTISCGTALNPFNPPDYLATMLDVRNEDPAMISRKIEGDFTPIHSLIYGTYWTPDTHIIPIEKILAYWELDRDGMMGVDAIPRDWPIHVGIDPAGNSSPWAIEIYVETPPDEYGNNQYLAIDEIYVKGYSWGEMAEMILKRTIDKGWNSIHYWIDPFFGNQKHGPNPKSVREEFLEYGINCQIPRNYTKLPAIERVREFLRCDNAHPHPYVEDEIEDDVTSPHFGKWKKGTSMLYYVSSPEYVSSNPKKFNPHGVINWYNLKEKEVYRLDGTKERQSKENEEGLSKAGPEKIIDRDDHAQTAEMFVALGIRPLMRTGRERNRAQLRNETPRAYTTQTARERFSGRRG